LALTRLLGLNVPETLALLFQAIAPGGGYSNVVTYWLDGDLNLR